MIDRMYTEYLSCSIALLYAVCAVAFCDYVLLLLLLLL
jgi:hypothetical protein